MSTTTTAETTTTASTQGNGQSGNTIKKTPAKKAPTKAAPKPEKKADGTVYTYEATGRFGVTNRRTFPHKVAVAADVRDPSHPSPRWQGGLITRFFVSEDAAQRYVERQRESGCDVVLVPAKLVSEDAK